MVSFDLALTLYLWITRPSGFIGRPRDFGIVISSQGVVVSRYSIYLSQPLFYRERVPEFRVQDWVTLKYRHWD